MRPSTLFFLALFAAFLLWGRARHGIGRGLRVACVPACAARENPDDDGRGARVRALQSELDRLERRGRELARSLQAVSQSAQKLRELAGRHGDAAVRAELREVEAGLEKLRELRARTEVECVAVAARLELARSGLLDEPPEPSSGPVDALSGVERVTAGRFSARAR
jgi:hypothetical protein